jgi:hypothetical protein
LSVYDEEAINRAFGIVGRTFLYKFCNVPALYIVDDKIVGVGHIYWLIFVRPEWYVVGAGFTAGKGMSFQKILLVYQDDIYFNRCHSYYIDNIDLKTGGTHTIYQDYEIIASLLKHGIEFDINNCDSCRGENPMQTHYIEVITRGINVEKSKIQRSPEKEKPENFAKDTEET